MLNAQPNNLLDKIGLIPGSLKFHKNINTCPAASLDPELVGEPVIYSLGSLLAQWFSLSPGTVWIASSPHLSRPFFSLHFCDAQIRLSAELLPTHSLPTSKVLLLA